MTPKQFAALVAAAAVSLATAIAVYAYRGPWTPDTTNAGKLVPSLEANAGKVGRIVVTQGGSTLTIEKSGDKWLVKSQDGYPASPEKIRALLVALAEAKLLEPKTRVSTRFGLLEVDDPKSKTSNARLIKLEDASGTVLAEVIAGKTKPGHAASGAAASAGTYVRRPGEDQSWLASANIAGGAALKDWTNPRVFETQTEKVNLLTVEIQGEPPYQIKRTADGTHELQAIPAGKKIKYVNMIDNIVEAASFLDFERIRKQSAAPGGDAGIVKFETDNGLKITLKVRRDKDAVWMTVDASGEGEAKKIADEIEARANGWEFEVIPSKADTMLKKMADLLEDAAS